MTQSNSVQKVDDFKFAIVIRIEGRNSRAIVLRVAGIVAALIAIGVRIAIILIGSAH